MFKNLLLLITTLCFSLTVFASGSTKNAKTTNSFLPVTKVDKATSTFNWKGTKKLGDNHYGTIKLKKASAVLKKGKVMSGEFVMDMNNFDSEDLPAKTPKGKKLIGHLKSPDFFNVAKYPTAKLVLNKISNGKAVGKLTIMGKTHPITVPYKQEGNSFKGTMTFDRTKYGMIYNSGNFFKKLVDKKVINNEVTIDFNVNLI